MTATKRALRQTEIQDSRSAAFHPSAAFHSAGSAACLVWWHTCHACKGAWAVRGNARPRVQMLTHLRNASLCLLLLRAPTLPCACRDPLTPPTACSLELDTNGALDSSSLSQLTSIGVLRQGLRQLDLGENALSRFPTEVWSVRWLHQASGAVHNSTCGRLASPPAVQAYVPRHICDP